MDLPKAFEWLAPLTGPLMIVEALKLYGTVETPGAGDNPTILEWAKETGLDHQGYIHDEIPWCGLFMAVVAKRAGKLPPPSPLMALSWMTFGINSSKPSLGDVLVYRRFNDAGKIIGGHVTLYVGEDDANHYGLGGNQGDAVTIAPKPKDRLFVCRRPIYKTQPKEVRPVKIGLVASNPSLNKEV